MQWASISLRCYTSGIWAFNELNPGSAKAAEYYCVLIDGQGQSCGDWITQTSHFWGVSLQTLKNCQSVPGSLLLHGMYYGGEFCF
jgi:hypothetical protein